MKKNTKLVWPLWDHQAPIMQRFGDNQRVYRQFGQEGHNGIDIGVDRAGVLAMASGTVRFAGEGVAEVLMGASAGTCILIDHGGFYTGYAHLTSLYIQAGDEVKAGQVIGISGSSGMATGPHLHAELIAKPLKLGNGYLGRIDPTPYLIAPHPLTPTPPTVPTPPTEEVAP